MVIVKIKIITLKYVLILWTINILVESDGTISFKFSTDTIGIVSMSKPALMNASK